jgi:endonuclease/exonuclease/phosphatase family metal-dependent hydrolase
MIDRWRAASPRERLLAIVPWALLAPWAAWALVRGFGLERGFPLVPIVSYTPYVAVVAIVPIAVAALMRRWVAAALAVAVAGSLVAAVLPRALPDAGADDHGGPRLRVLSSNIHRGRADLGLLMELIRERRPQVLSIQELTPRAATRLRRLGLERLLPERLLAIRRGPAGAGLYSRFPLRRLPAPRFGFRMPRAALRLPDGTAVEVVVVHPFPPNRNQVDLWGAGLRSLPSGSHGPLRILAGDFNATLDHQEMRGVLDRGYRDAADLVGGGLTPTWPSGRILLPPVTIDHVLVDERAGVEDFSVHDLPGTDHKVLFANLALGPEKG